MRPYLRLSLLAASMVAAAASAAAQTTTPAPSKPATPAPASTPAAAPAAPQLTWKLFPADTVGRLLIGVEMADTVIRIAIDTVGSTSPVVTEPINSDSVLAWAKALNAA